MAPGQAQSAIFVVEVRTERGGARVLVRAAESPAVESFTSADALWAFLLDAPRDAASSPPTTD